MTETALNQIWLCSFGTTTINFFHCASPHVCSDLTQTQQQTLSGLRSVSPQPPWAHLSSPPRCRAAPPWAAPARGSSQTSPEKKRCNRYWINSVWRQCPRKYVALSTYSSIPSWSLLNFFTRWKLNEKNIYLTYNIICFCDCGGKRSEMADCCLYFTCATWIYFVTIWKSAEISWLQFHQKAEWN